MKRILLLIFFIGITSLTFSQASLYVASQRVSCAGICDGSATANFIGGTAPYSYTWQPGGFIGANVANLCTGQYTVYAEDALGTSLNAVATIIQPKVEINIFNGCYGLCSAEVAANVFYGTYPYTYLWSNGITSQTLTLCTGNYSVQVTDANGCIATQTTSVLSPPQMSVTINKTNVSCLGLCDGSANINVSGGSGSFKYEFYTWNGSNIPITAMPSNLCSNSYSVIVSDSITGCQAFEYLNILEGGGNHTIPNASITSTSYNESCLSAGNGSINVAVSGTNPGPYSYLWSNGATTQDAANLTSDPYWVTISDANSNCLTLYDTVYAVNAIPGVTFSSMANNETCALSGDGFIDVSALGSNSGPFTYQWNTGTNTQDIYNITSGIYSVTIADNNNHCVVLSDTITAIGTNCGSISGNVYIDNNGNCVFDSGDGNSICSSVSIQPGNRIAYTDVFGNFTVGNLPYATYSVSLISGGYIYMYPVCNTTLNININSLNPSSINNQLPVGFSSATQPDVYVGAYSNGIVPGFASHVIYNLGNFNNVDAAGKLKITLPPNYTSAITSVSPMPYNISGDTVIWNFSNVNYYNSIWPIYNTNYFVEFVTPITEPLGSTFTSSIMGVPTIPDLNNTNNITYYQRLVTGSFDPNEKTVSPVGSGINGDISSDITDLTYLIRFQNTGNGPAVNIVVKDTLSPNLDVSTFEMLGASHSYHIDILQGNILRWKFNNIMLADSNHNEAASHGYIKYRIKRTNNNSSGTQIKNRAYIYFDFNAPVVTNSTLNTISTVLSLTEKADNNLFHVYPNPTNSILNISDEKNHLQNSTIEIKNYLNQVVFKSPFTNQINLSNLSTGLYFLTIKDKETNKTIKIIKE